MKVHMLHNISLLKPCPKVALAALMLVPYLPTPAYAGMTSAVARRSAAKIANAPRWKRGKGLAALRAVATAPALAPAPGPSLPWEPAFPFHKGQADPMGRMIQCGYDGDGQLTGIGDGTSATSYLYDARHRLTQVNYGNGVVTTYGYDAAGRLTSTLHKMSGLGGTYAWNADGTIASMPANGYRRVLSYDEEGRLTEVSKLLNGATTAMYQYGYGFDGNRRWRKDLAANVWDW